jgi:hypothetical protein
VAPFGATSDRRIACADVALNGSHLRICEISPRIAASLLPLQNLANPAIRYPRFLRTNDSVYEIHRIVFGFSHELYIVKVECLIDSSYNLIFKKGSVCNPVTKYGICNLEKQTTNKLSKATWTEFKNKLKKPDIYDLTLWVKNMSSIGPGLEWEAVIGYKTYRFSDDTGFHDQFSEACGFLLKQVPDKELHQMLKKYPMN